MTSKEGKEIKDGIETLNNFIEKLDVPSNEKLKLYVIIDVLDDMIRNQEDDINDLENCISRLEDTVDNIKALL